MNNKQYCLHIKHCNRQLFVVLLLSLMIFANPSCAFTGDICKSEMIENINHGNFEDAIQNLKCVEDWTFDAEDDNDFLDIEKAVDFIFYADSTDLNRKTYHSFVLYFKDEMDFIGNSSYDKKDYKSAADMFEISLSIIEFVFGESDINYAYVSNDLARVYYTTGNYKQAENYFLKALEIYRSELSEQSENYAISLNNIGVVYSDMGEYKKAEKYYLEALEIRKSLLGEQHPAYASSLNNLGTLYMDMKDYAQAETYFLNALAIRKSVLGEYHPDYAQSLHNLGALYVDIDSLVLAEKYYLEALAIRKSVFGEQHPNYVASLNGLGTCYYRIGNYAMAEKYLSEALDLRKSIFGRHHPDYAQSLYNLGMLYNKKGDYAKAEEYYLKSLEIRKSIFGEQHSDYASSLINLGNVYQETGNFVRAEYYYLKASEIIASILGKKNLTYAIVLNNLGKLYSTMGDYSRAESYYLDVIQIRKSVLGTQHPDYAMALNNIGHLYSLMGDYTQAKSYYLRSLDIIKSVFGETHPNYATLLMNLGGVCSSMGNYEKAEGCLLKSLEVQNIVLGKENYTYAMSLMLLGQLYLLKEDYEKAEPFYLDAMKIGKSIRGEYHPNYVSILNNTGSLYTIMGNYAEAEKYLKPAMLQTKKNYIQLTDFMSERQRESFWKTRHDFFSKQYPYLAYRYYIEKPSISTFAYDIELFNKGLLLTSSENIRRSILESNDSALIRQWNELTTKKQQIQVWQEKNPQSKYLAELKEEAEQLEKAVTKSSAVFRRNQEQWNITWDSVRNHLADNEVAIEYLVAPINEDSTMYCALLLRHDSEYPALVPLFEEKEVAALVNVSTGNQTNFTYSYDAYGEEICHRVWDKIQPYVREGETIYFSPAGLFHQLAIESLPYDEDHTLADVYHMVRLSSTREIAMRHRAPKHSSATLYGGIEYDMTDTELLAASSPYQQTNLLASRGIDNDTLNRGNVQYLEGTLHEVENIYSMLVGNRSHRIKAQLYKAKAGNEESFKSLSGKRQNILHIATHGFFWTDAVAQRKELFTQRSLMMSFDRNQHTPPTIDPLTRCGLLLAGANTALSGHSKDLPEGVQDGILTAKEISLMDLREADLVVLSACETGRGEITSEGVFGLQRAFKQAGVQTIVMSLWKVSDVATQLLMTEFYRNWLTLGQAKREAFRNAQNTVRQQYPNPEFWAGFVMID